MQLAMQLAVQLAFQLPVQLADRPGVTRRGHVGYASHRHPLLCSSCCSSAIFTPKFLFFLSTIHAHLYKTLRPFALLQIASRSVSRTNSFILRKDRFEKH